MITLTDNVLTLKWNTEQDKLLRTAGQNLQPLLDLGISKWDNQVTQPLSGVYRVKSRSTATDKNREKTINIIDSGKALTHKSATAYA